MPFFYRFRCHVTIFCCRRAPPFRCHTLRLRCRLIDLLMLPAPLYYAIAMPSMPLRAIADCCAADIFRLSYAVSLPLFVDISPCRLTFYVPFHAADDAAFAFFQLSRQRFSPS